MSAALGTLPFLATLWLVVVLGARILEESGAKIAAALKGEHRRQSLYIAPIRVRVRRSAKPMCATAKWRVAA